MNPKSHPWQKSAMALAAAALFGLSATQVSALALGSIIVQSSLGEPLRAEIDIPDINAEEAASLKATVATPEAFRAAGLEFNPALSGLKATLLRRANGRAYIRLTSDRAVNEPFVDMILEASWSSGRIVRDYTMLFDPPNLRGPATAGATTVPAVGSGQSSAATAPSGPGSSVSAGAAIPAAQATVAPPRAGARPAGPAVSSKPATASDGSITVKRGDTASKIAGATKPASVSLDQMLVALLNANPDAFINYNINRIKAGAVINIPTAAQAQAVEATEASQTVIAQSRDFGDFRKKLAANAPTERVAAADRKSGGSIQGKVDDKKASASAPDKLTLSKGAITAQAETERIAKQRATKEAATRAAEVSKNMSDLAKLGATPGVPATAVAGSTAASAAAPVVSYTAPVAVAAPAASMPATPPVAAVSAPVAKPVVVAPVAAKPAARAAPPVVAEPTLIDQLTENPLLPAAGIGLVALLAGFGIYRSRQRRKAAMEDSVFLESRLQPDSFFGASGGQKVDTNDGVGGSSMVYTPSQLDAADDVDPVAEADVYLAYGRDIQAEEILKEALKFNPGRVAIHHKLLEIYAKRRDLIAFEGTANDAFRASNGEGADWNRVCEMGLSIDPTNTLYLPGGKPSSAVPLDLPATVSKDGGLGLGATAAAVAGVAAAGSAMAGSAAANSQSSAASSFAAATTPLTPLAGAATPVDLSFDLDLDFSLDEENASVMQALGNIEKTAKMPALNSAPAPLDMDFDLPMADVPSSPPLGSGPLEFDLPKNGAISVPALAVGEAEEFKHQAAVSFGTTVAGPLATFAAKAAPPAPDNGGMLEFDLGSLSLDLNDSTEGTSLVESLDSQDRLATKLSLAEEFNTIGDEDGARALIEEVILEATGDMKARAQAALAKLN